MSLQALNTILNLEDPLKECQVEFTITEMPTLLLAKLQQKLVGLVSGNSRLVDVENLHFRATSFSYPGSKISRSTFRIGPFVRRIATNQDKSGEWTCTIVEDQGGGVLNLIQSWCDLVQNNIFSIRFPFTMYSTCAQLKMEGKKGARTIWLKGFYPVSYQVSQIDPSGVKPVSITVTFNYNYFAENSYSVFSLLN